MNRRVAVILVCSVALPQPILATAQSSMEQRVRTLESVAAIQGEHIARLREVLERIAAKLPITGANVVDNSLTGLDIDESTLGVVPEASFATQAGGINTIVRVTAPSPAVPPGQASSSIFAMCPFGWKATGGGVETQNGVRIEWSAPRNGDGWMASIDNASTTHKFFNVVALCIPAGGVVSRTTNGTEGDTPPGP